jgi:hypothetical protein
MRLLRSIGRRGADLAWRVRDAVDLYRLGDSAAREMKRYLLVGCESSGTTPLAHMLFRGSVDRFLIEGRHPWVWDVYRSVYQRRATIRDFPRLRLFDAIKVPGFAVILEEFVAEFPNTEVVYLVRDPRDVIASAFRTWGVETREQLADVSWVSEEWLGIRSEDPIARLAERWVIYLERSQRAPGVHYVRYEDFCADKVGFVLELAARLGLAVDEAALSARGNVQASGWREYAPAGPSSWRDYLDERDVETVERICGEQMSRWDYSPARISS